MVKRKLKKEPLVKPSPCEICPRNSGCGSVKCLAFTDWFSFSWSKIQTAFGANPWNIRRPEDIAADIAERGRRSDKGKPRGRRKKT